MPRALPPRLLLTGFEPFGGETENPSAQIVQALHGRRIAGHRIATAILPVVFGDSLLSLQNAIDTHEPALVLCIGQAGGRSQISLERVAINLDDARIPDNAGRQPVDQRIVARGPAAYFSTLPIKAMLVAMARAGHPVEISQTAGTFVCNHVFYGLMHALRKSPGVRGGFVHVPYSPEQAARHPGTPGLPVGQAVEALRLGLRAAITMDHDLRIVGGAEH